MTKNYETVPFPNESEAIYQELGKIRAAPQVWNTHSDLRSFFRHGIHAMRESHMRQSKNDKSLHHVTVVVGFPTSGKTYSRELLERLYTLELKDLSIGPVTWDNSREQVLGRIGIVDNVKAQRPGSKALSGSVNQHFAISGVHAIEKTDASLWESPAMTAGIINGELVGSDLGTSVLRDLVSKQGVFARVERPYTVKIAGLVGGLLLRSASRFYRDGIKNAQSLSEAQEIAELFGKPVPQTDEDLERRKKEGASLEQITALKRILFGLERMLFMNGRLSLPRGHPITRLAIEAAVLEDFYQKTLNLSGAQSNSIFIGVNDPDRFALGIPSMKYLAEYLRKKSYFHFPMSDETKKLLS